MEEKSHTKRRVGVFFVLILMFGIFLFIILSNKNTQNNSAISENTVEIKKQCYVWNTPLGDNATLILTTRENAVEGSLTFLPAEKDSKRGIFTGTLSALSGDSGVRTIYGWWNVFAEGMNSKEEIIIMLSENTASVGFGEMKENTEGSYVYADVANISYQPVLQETSCGNLALK